MTNFNIGELAKKSGVSTDTIRYYERLDLVQPENRSRAGYRIYNSESIRVLLFIRRAKDLGFTLAETKNLLDIKASTTATCQEMKESTKTKIAYLNENIVQLNLILNILTNLEELCPGGDKPLSECPILDYLYPERK